LPDIPCVPGAAQRRSTAPQSCCKAALNSLTSTPTHLYPGQVLIARELFAQHEGSQISYLESAGLLGPRLNIVHSVWISRRQRGVLESCFCSVAGGNVGRDHSIGMRGMTLRRSADAWQARSIR
jgi:hypothetical protein